MKKYVNLNTCRCTEENNFSIEGYMPLNDTKVNYLSICLKTNLMAIFCLYSDARPALLSF